jgi:hypothetical protein
LKRNIVQSAPGSIVQSAPGSVIQVSENAMNKAYMTLENMNIDSI